MKRKDVLVFLIPTALIVVLWVVFSVYHSFVTSTIPDSLNAQIISIDPRFDTKTIDSIKQRANVSPQNQFQTSGVEGEVSPTPTPPETPISTSSGKQASTGGILQ